jgi:hypothetical protein
MSADDKSKIFGNFVRRVLAGQKWLLFLPGGGGADLFVSPAG